MIPAQESLARLRAGNRRFVAEVQSRATRPTEARRLEVAAGQEPFAIILGCADSRCRRRSSSTRGWATCS